MCRKLIYLVSVILLLTLANNGSAADPNDPPDGTTDVPTDVVLYWSNGFEGTDSDVYLGTDPDAVANADRTSPEYKGCHIFQSYDPGGLAECTSYCWRIDEVLGETVVLKGDVWSFTTVCEAEALVFSQLDFNLDGTIYTDTEWGAVDFAFTGREPMMYFNLAVNGTWQVQNVPVLSIEGAGLEQTMTYCFDLGTERGTDVDVLTYDYAFTLEVLDTMPGGVFTAAVVDGYVAMWPGIIEAPPILPLAELIAGGTATSTTKYAHKNFPNQDCGEKECCPAAVSNSLQFLSKKCNLGVQDDKLSISEMKKATKWGENGCRIDHDDNRPAGERNAWWEDKKKYMEDNNYLVTTRKITDLSKLAEEIEDGQDVELQGDWHTAAIVGITDLGGGKFSIDVAHDTKQGQAGGTKTETITYDPNTKKFTGSPGFFDGSSFRYAVVECPEYLVLDDFELYDLVEHKISQTWVDGLSAMVEPPGYPSNGTGSKVDLAMDPVHGGEQSMAFEYANDLEWLGVYYSETERTFDAPRDWTKCGVKRLALWFYGDPDNDYEPIYMALEDSTGATGVVYLGDFEAPLIDTWQQWIIDLQEFSEAAVNLAGVKKIYIGAGGRGNTTTPGGTGTLYFDDLRLYSTFPECGLAGDINGDCAVDFKDIAILAADWLREIPRCVLSGGSGKGKCRYELDEFEPYGGGKCPWWAQKGMKCWKGYCYDDDDCDDTVKTRMEVKSLGWKCEFTWELMDCAKSVLKTDCTIFWSDVN